MSFEPGDTVAIKNNILPSDRTKGSGFIYYRGASFIRGDGVHPNNVYGVIFSNNFILRGKPKKFYHAEYNYFDIMSIPMILVERFEDYYV